MEYKCSKFSVLGFGFALGIISALSVLIMGLSAWLFDLGHPVVTMVGSLYVGYNATFIGSIIGAIWSFVDGFIAGVIFAWIYNLFVKHCHHHCETREVPTVLKEEEITRTTL